jgi:hypothetical protein
MKGQVPNRNIFLYLRRNTETQHLKSQPKYMMIQPRSVQDISYLEVVGIKHNSENGQHNAI